MSKDSTLGLHDDFMKKMLRGTGASIESAMTFLTEEILRGHILLKAQEHIIAFATAHGISDFPQLQKTVEETPTQIWMDLFLKLQGNIAEHEKVFYARSAETFLMLAPIVLSRIVSQPFLDLREHKKARAALELYHAVGILCIALLPTYIQLSEVFSHYTTGNTPLKIVIVLPYFLAGAEGVYSLARLIRPLIPKGKKAIQTTEPTTQWQTVGAKDVDSSPPSQMNQLLSILRQYGIPDQDLLQDKRGQEALLLAMVKVGWKNPQAAVSAIEEMERLGDHTARGVRNTLVSVVSRAVEVKSTIQHH